MNRFLNLLPVIILFLTFSSALAQRHENPFRKPDIIDVLSRPAKSAQFSPHSQIKGIQFFGAKSGIAFTGNSLFRTDDKGENWREIILPKGLNETISGVSFLDKNIGSLILADQENAALQLFSTNDGGNLWLKTPFNIKTEDLIEADLQNAQIEFLQNGELVVSFRLPTSSNFDGKVFYESSNNGQIWNVKKRELEIRRGDEILTEKKQGSWMLKTEGNCERAKIGCIQETKIFADGKEITPPQIKEFSQIEKENARTEAQNSVFAAPPNGSTRISLNRGFDKCTAATVSQMQTWWDNSPLYDSNIYISGRNRGCTQPQLNAAWVSQISEMGWGLIPTIVGYQSPCSVCTNCQKHSSDPTVAETQGSGEADIAIADANNLGLMQGTVLYYDMERYDDVSGTGACSTPTKAFLKGWTDRLKQLGYISGVYGSPTNAVNDWINIPLASRMDVVWLARWNNIMSVWGVAPLPDTFWTNHQRIHQWLGPRNETWGGITFNIDNNISDAPVAGAAFAKNKNADFDGDGKSDISVFRPGSGVWYILNSSNSAFNFTAFGLGTDILAPGDYDGDGKTDTAVYRPSEGNWYILTKAGTFSSKQFGTSGDIPVPADYNGDGKTDTAVFRPSNGVWYIANSDSRGTYTITQFGQNGDKPVLGDYDGDNKSDIAVWRPSSGIWYVLRSSDNSLAAVGFGISTDKPAQGDYDGDGKTDYAVFRDGVWYLLQSTSGNSIVQFGLAGDMPVTGDFDGDNKADIAVFRPSNGVWYLLQSQNGFRALSFGLADDKTIPNAYLPQ